MNKIIIITGPSGSGKTTLTDKLLEMYSDSLKRIKTYTTRPFRSDEDSNQYIFKDQEQFLEYIENDNFIEYEEVYSGVYYGTSKTSIIDALDDNNNYILCMDVKGALKLKSILRNRCVTVFCNPGSYETIQNRLSHRPLESNTIEREFKYTFEMSYLDMFDLEVDSSQDIQITLSNFKHEVLDKIKNKTVVVNLYGGPGTGKSTMAAALFSELKFMNINCELVTEYAKDKVWEESINTLSDQVYIFAKHHHRIWNLLNKVDVIITDSPIIMASVYTPDSEVALKTLTKEYHFKNNNLEVFLIRNKPYNTKGRMQTEVEARVKDQEILQLLDTNFINYRQVYSNKNSVQEIVQMILNKIGAQ